MISQLAIIALVGLASAQYNKYCHGNDCPEYTVLNSTADFEVRKYSPSQWARTSIDAKRYEDAVDQAFHRLFNYIDGDNSKNEKIPMTSPVTVKVIPGAGPYCDSTFVESFFVPPKFQPTPPTPNNHNITIESQDVQIVYSRGFSGYAQPSDFVQQATDLAAALASANVAFNSSVYFTVEYDGPYTIVDRHNEVWFYPL